MRRFAITKPTFNKQRCLGQIRRRIAQMPPLSTTVTKVMEVCNNPKTSPQDLNRIISLDPVLTGKVLRMINSAYYSLPSKVNSLTRAIIMLGLRTVVNLASSAAIMDSLDTGETFRAFSMDDFWTHSICVGVMAKLLAHHNRVPAALQEEYFVAGLLHDLGKIPINSCFSEEYLKVLELTGPDQGSLLQAETVIFELDHCIVGQLIAENWYLGPVLNESIRHHHDPEAAMEENREIIASVALGNIYANMAQIGSSGDSFTDKDLGDRLLKQMHMRWDELPAFHERILEEIEKAKVFLQVQGEAPPEQEDHLKDNVENGHVAGGAEG